MNPLVAGVALAVVAGAVVAVSSRDGRAAILGLTVVLVASPLVADPLPEPLALAGRLAGSILGAYVLWIAVRVRPEAGLLPAPTGGSRLGWPAEVLLAGAAAIVGFASHGLGAPGAGPALASAAGIAVATVALLPATTGRDLLRVGMGLVLLADAALLLRTGLTGTSGPLEHLLGGTLIAALGASLGAVALAGRMDGNGGFALASEARPRARREPDAHLADPS